MVVSQPTQAYMSQLGHYNFLYPNFHQKIVVPEQTNLTKLSWAMQDNCSAYLMVTGLNQLVVWIEN